MSAPSPEDTLAFDRPKSDTSPTTTSRPSLFVSLVWFLMVAQLSWAVAGVSLAMAGVFSLATVLPVWAVLGAVLWVATRSARSASAKPAHRSTSWIRLTAVAVAIAAVVFNGAFPAELLETGRDGGTYTATAGWLANDGGLLIDADVPPFDDTDGLGFKAAGFHETVPDGPLYAQFMHAFPAMLATVDLVAGLEWMVRTNALFGGLALLALYAFGERVTRPWAALVAQLALAGNLVFMYFTRAPFSELLTMGLLFGGLWALDQAVEQRHRTTGFLAGLLLGGTFIARLDGLVVLLMIIAALSPPVVSNRLRRVAPAALAGVGVSCTVAVIDLFVFSPVYVDLHVHYLVPLGVGFVAVGLLAALASTTRGRALARKAMRHRRVLATMLATIIVVAGVLAFTVRPSFAVATWNRTTPIGYLQQAEGQPVDETRTYAEQSAVWLSWYLGVPALAVALLGWAGLVRHAVARRISRLAPFVLSMSALTTLYVWMPSITPDHIWADRRFLPIVVPGLLLCAGWLLAEAWRLAASRHWRVPAHGALAVAAILLVAAPLRASAPLAGLHEEGGLAREIAHACDRLGDDAAVLLLGNTDRYLSYHLHQPLRGHCGIPAAWAAADTISSERMLELAERAPDRTLYVLSDNPEFFEGRPVGDVFTLLRHRSVRLEQTLTMPPRDLVSYGREVFAAPVTPAAAEGDVGAEGTQVTTTWNP